MPKTTQILLKTLILAVLLLSACAALAIFSVTRQTIIPMIIVAVILSLYAVWRIHEAGSVLLTPLLLVILLLTVLPMVYSFGVSFTNYSSSHQMSLQQLQAELSKRLRIRGDSADYSYDIIDQGDSFLSLRISDPVSHNMYTSSLFRATDIPDPVELKPLDSDIDFNAEQDEALEYPWLKSIILAFNDGRQLVYQSGKFHEAGLMFQLQSDGSVTELESGDIYRPDNRSGFYVDEAHKVLTPGYISIVGWSNYLRLFGDPDLALPLLQVLLWSLGFALVTVMVTFVIGLFLAMLINYPGLSGRGLYQSLLVLPVAVPVVVTGQMFKGLLGNGYGDINQLINEFGWDPLWLMEPWGTRLLVIAVNIWVCYPICFLASQKLVQRLPSAIIEYATLDGVHWLRKWWSLLLPILIRELLPLLSLIFAFSFNNLTLVQLLTDGAPIMLGSNPAVGATDTLVHWNYHLVFEDDRFNFGLASALACCLFLFMALWILIHTRLRRSERDIERAMQEKASAKAG